MGYPFTESQVREFGCAKALHSLQMVHGNLGFPAALIGEAFPEFVCGATTDATPLDLADRAQLAVFRGKANLAWRHSQPRGGG
jgi:hypothetical protein